MAATVLGLVAACSTTGGAAGTPGATPSSGPSTAPSSSPAAVPSSPAPSSEPGSAPPGDAVIDSAEEAVAAVVAEHPEFADHLLRFGPGRPGGSPGPIIGDEPIVGLSAWAVVSRTAEGFLVTFVTGFGDCPAGCIEHRLDVYLVLADGTVTHRCTIDAAPDALPPDRSMPVDPCGSDD